MLAGKAAEKSPVTQDQAERDAQGDATVAVPVAAQVHLVLRGRTYAR